MGHADTGRHDRTDAELLAAHVAGDRYAFEELYRRHHRRLRQLARDTTDCPEDAEDALQDAMLSAHRGAGSFRYNAAVGSWLHRIVVNACLDRLRRRGIRCAELLEEHAAVGDRTDAVAAALAVRDALDRLPADQRAAVMAVDMQDCSIAAAAGVLGIPEGTVKSRCARGRARLAVLLDRCHTDRATVVRPGRSRIALAAEGAGADCA